MKKVWLVVLSVVLAACSVVPLASPMSSPAISPVVSPTAASANGIVEGKVTIGPLTPGPQRADETPPPIPPEVYAAYIIRIYQSDGATVVMDVKIDSDGMYRAELPPGNYMLGTSRADGGRTLMRGSPQPIEIVSGQTLQIDINIDTGLR